MSAIAAEIYGQALVLKPKGELTEETLAVFSEATEHHMSSNDVRDVVFDVADVSFVDSAALEYLLDLQDRLAERLGQVRLVGCDEYVRMILQMTRLDDTFELFDEVGQAVKDAAY